VKDLIDHSTIHFSSAIDDSSGVVYVRWLQGQYEGYWEAEIAINLATALLLVAGVALAEATLSEALLESQDLKPDSEEYKVKQAQVLHLIRSTRMEIHPQLQPIFGYHTQQPLVEIGWYKTERTTTIEGAIQEAKIMLEAANTAIIDGLLSKSLTASGIKDRLQQKVFQKMREARS
jgi:hypothetical protein